MALAKRFGVEIRAAHAADAGELARLLQQTEEPLGQLTVAARIEAFRQTPDGTALVATGYGGLSGFVAVGWFASFLHTHPVARVSALVVDVEMRRQGIGRMLLKAASQAARSHGCDTLEWAPGADRAAAEMFGQATGFRAEGALFTRSLRRRGGE